MTCDPRIPFLARGQGYVSAIFTATRKRAEDGRPITEGVLTELGKELLQRVYTECSLEEARNCLASRLPGIPGEWGVSDNWLNEQALQVLLDGGSIGQAIEIAKQE